MHLGRVCIQIGESDARNDRNAQNVCAGEKQKQKLKQVVIRHSDGKKRKQDSRKLCYVLPRWMRT